MRTKVNLRVPRALHAAAGAVALAVPGVAAALESGVAQALGATTGPALHTSVSRHSLGYDSYLTVHGTAPSSDAGQEVALQFMQAGHSAWRGLASTTVRSDDDFSFRLRLARSGQLRAVAVTPTSPTPSAQAASASTQPSTPQRVGVNAALRDVSRHSRVAQTGHRIALRGRLLPTQDGLTVRLLGRSGRGWRTLARTRTGRRGGFDLRYAVRSTGRRTLRVSFAGDRSNRGTWVPAGSVTGLVPRVASWYNDAGSTACGFHAHFGVANKTLPCGTKVTIAYHGRSVVATVDDRGPYVAGRTYDLNQNTAGALGMYGVATVLASR
jgi:rare lipoprotein A